MFISYSFILRNSSVCVICETPTALSLCQKHFTEYKQYEDTDWFRFLKANIQMEARRAKRDNWRVVSLDAIMSQIESPEHDKGNPTKTRWVGV